MIAGIIIYHKNYDDITFIKHQQCKSHRKTFLQKSSL